VGNSQCSWGLLVHDGQASDIGAPAFLRSRRLAFWLGLGRGPGTLGLPLLFFAGRSLPAHWAQAARLGYRLGDRESPTKSKRQNGPASRAEEEQKQPALWCPRDKDDSTHFFSFHFPLSFPVIPAKSGNLGFDYEEEPCRVCLGKKIEWGYCGKMQRAATLDLAHGQGGSGFPLSRE
jgi:hypothetical protein